VSGNKSIYQIDKWLPDDIAIDMWILLFSPLKLLPALMPLSRRLHSSTRTAENSERTARTWLFFESLNRRQPRISAENQTSMADNSLPKQRKQREAQCLV
jgi:hypothetical protein